MTSRRNVVRRGFRALVASLAIALAVCPARSMAAPADNAAESRQARSADPQEAAERELAEVRAAVARARNAASWAKADVEQAAAAQLEVQKAAGPDDSPAPSRAANDPAAKHTARPAGRGGLAKAAVDSLKQQINDLKAQRAELLGHMTAVHPLIVDADLRIEELVHELAGLTGSSATAETLPPPAPAAPQTAGQSDVDQKRRDEASANLRQSLAKWDTAQKELQTAIDAELAATQRLAAVTTRARAAQPTPVPSALTADVEATEPSSAAPAAAPAPPTSRPAARSGSQPLVLAALFVALVVAAFASVKLARTTDETVFAGADDAAAVLALPVVGIIPALSGGAARGAILRRFRALVLLGQLLIAVVVFATIAYCVQNPAALWQLFTSPLETLRSGPR